MVRRAKTVGMKCRWKLTLDDEIVMRRHAASGSVGPMRGKIFAEEDGGFGILVVAVAVGVSAPAVDGDGSLKGVFAVEVDPAEPGGAGGFFEGVHEAGGNVVAAECWEDEEAFALGCMRDGVGCAVEDAADDFR